MGAIMDYSDTTDAQLATIVAMSRAFRDRFGLVETQAREALMDRTGEDRPTEAYVGDVRVARLTWTRGGRDVSYTVSDPTAYARWLADNGHGDMVERMPMPVGEALDGGYVRALVRGSGGVIPDGVRTVDPKPAQLRLRLDAQADRLLDDPLAGRRAQAILAGGRETA